LIKKYSEDKKTTKKQSNSCTCYWLACC